MYQICSWKLNKSCAKSATNSIMSAYQCGRAHDEEGLQNYHDETEEVGHIAIWTAHVQIKHWRTARSASQLVAVGS